MKNIRQIDDGWSARGSSAWRDVHQARERAVTRAGLGLALALTAACSPASGNDSPDAGDAGDAGADAQPASDAAPDATPNACASPDASSPAFASRQFGGTSQFPSEAPWGLAVDGAGSVVLAGEFDGTIDFGGGTLTSSGLGSLYLAKLDEAGAHVFSAAWGGPDALSLASAKSVAVDAAGNIAVSGYTTGFVDLGDGALPNGSFVAKFDPSGKLLWSHGFAGYGVQDANQVVFDAAGDVVLTGEFQGSVDFGGGALPNPGGTNAVGIAAFDASGKHLSSKLFPPSTGGSAAALALAVDGAGDVALAGSFSGTIDFGTGALTSAANATDAFVVVVDAQGGAKVAKAFGGSGYDEAESIAFDSKGGVVASGRFEDGIDFGGGLVTSAGAGDAFVVALGSSGKHRWSKRFGDTQEDDATGLTVDALGRAVITGSFNGTVDFGGGGVTSAGGADVFVAVLDADGAYVRAARFGDSNADQFGYRIAVDGACREIVTGTFAGTIDFGQGTLTTGAGQPAIFLTGLAP